MKSVTILALAMTVLAVAGDWPQWRGVARDGKSTDSGLLPEWPASGPPLEWKAEGLGEGYSTVTVSQGRVFTLGQKGDTQYVIAVDEASGKKLWDAPNGGPYRERRGDGPRSVPTVERDRLWAFSADGTLSQLEVATGKKVWSLNVTGPFKGSVPHWGYSESPLIDGDRLIVGAGGAGHGLVALNKSTGKLVWKSQSDGAAYSSAVIGDVGGTRQVLAFSSQGALAVRADNGELLWRYENVANRTANIATPIVEGNHVFYSSDYGTGCALLKLESTGGGVKANEVYFNREMKNHYSSSVLVGDYLYGFSSSILTAMNFKTGEVAWRDRSVGKGSVTWADGLLYLLGENGSVALAEPTPSGYKERSRFSFAKSDRPAWAPIVVANGRMYIRDQGTLYCHRVSR